MPQGHLPALENAGCPSHCLGHMTLLEFLPYRALGSLPERGAMTVPLSWGSYIHLEDEHVDTCSSGHVHHGALNVPFMVLAPVCNCFPVSG